MKKKYSFIGYIVFSVVFLFVFNFNTKVMAGTQCTYTAEYPFTDDSSITSTQYDYMRYFFKKVSSENAELNDAFKILYKDFSEDFDKKNFTEAVFAYFINSRLNNFDNVYGGATKVSKINLIFTIEDNYLVDYGLDISYSDGGSNKYFESATGIPTDISSCPDLVVIKPNKESIISSFRDLYGWNLSSFDNNINNMMVSAFKDLESNYLFEMLIFMSNEAKIASGGIMYVNRAYNPDFDETQADTNLALIVDKYLKLDGFRDGLNVINDAIDEKLSGSGKGDKTIVDNAANLVKIIDDFDTIPRDLKILKYFNDTNVEDVSGLRAILNKFNSYYDGPKSEDWFDKYMPDSKARYVDALIIVLDWANKNAPTLKRLKELDIYKEEEEHCDADADCLRNLCKNKSDIAAQSYCYSSSVTDSDQAASACYSIYKGDGYYNAFCASKSDSELQKNMDALDNYIDERQEALDKYIEESVYNSIKTPGVEIKKDDELCEVLYGEDGLGVYIFGLLNVIRIGGPILIIILTAYDGIKMIASFKDDENKKFYNRLKIRLICLVILFLVPTLIKFLINLLIPEGTCLEYLKNI